VPEPTVLRTVLADYPHTVALKNGEVGSDRVRLDFTAVSPIHRAFAPMVRDEAYDVSELAVVTALQAIAYGRPVVLLPAVVASRFQRGCLIAHASRPVRPEDLAGRRVGVRAYTQTTGMWVRAHLAEDFGLAAGDIRWITHQEAHVAQYADPGFVERGADGANLPAMLREGLVDAAVLGNDLPGGDEFVRVVPDAEARDAQWWRRRRFMPVNHMVAAGLSACRRDPAAIREAYALLRRADAAVERPDGDGAPSPTLFGFERLREPLEFVVGACLAQGLLPRRLGVDEVFGPARDVLGDDAD
jgi:4,5-dihydroxyphthalate decarboxylase